MISNSFLGIIRFDTLLIVRAKQGLALDKRAIEQLLHKGPLANSGFTEEINMDDDYWLTEHDWDEEEELVCQVFASLGKPIASQFAKQWRQESCLHALGLQLFRWQLSNGNGMGDLRYG